jgi:hypothetical protein
MEKKATPRPAPEATQAPLPAERAFVVQLRAQSVPGGDLFVGRVEHVASGESVRFGSAEGLLAFIVKVLAPAPPPGESPASTGPMGNIG